MRLYSDQPQALKSRQRLWVLSRNKGPRAERGRRQEGIEEPNRRHRLNQCQTSLTTSSPRTSSLPVNCCVESERCSLARTGLFWSRPSIRGGTGPVNDCTTLHTSALTALMLSLALSLSLSLSLSYSLV